MMRLSVRYLGTLFTSITLALAFIYGALGIYYTSGGGTSVLYETFRMDREANIPTWYSSSLLLLSGLVATFIGLVKQERRDAFRRYWWGLAALFTYLSLDETAQLHEKWEYIYKPWTELEGAFLYGWVVPALFLVGAAALLYLRFFLHLPGRIKAYFFAGAALYVTGAVGAEMLQAYITDTSGLGTLTGIINLFEETLEILGANCFLYAFLLYLRQLPNKPIELV